MRVLWFTGVQLPAVTGDNLHRAGWQEGLRNALDVHSPDLELYIASFGSRPYSSFKKDNATYINVYRAPDPGSRCLRVVQNWKHQTYDQRELDACLKIVHELRPDLVYVFGTENPFGLIADQIKQPVVISIQAVLNGLIERIFKGLTLKEKTQMLFSRETLLGGGVFHKYFQLRKLVKMEKMIYQRTQFFEGRTSWDKNWLRKMNPSAKYFQIHRILAEQFYDHRWNPAEVNPNCIYTTSSNAPFKGALSLTRAFLMLKERGYQQLCLRIAGVHPDSFVGKTIRQLAKDKRAGAQITLLGRIPPENIIEEMLSAAVFVLPSHMDNSPNSLGEAMLLGMPCIASSAGGIPSMITNHHTGLIYAQDDLSALVDCLERYISNFEYAVKMGSNAREIALERHSPAKIVQNTIDMYHEVVNQERGTE